MYHRSLANWFGVCTSKQQCTAFLVVGICCTDVLKRIGRSKLMIFVYMPNRLNLSDWYLPNFRENIVCCLSYSALALSGRKKRQNVYTICLILISHIYVAQRELLVSEISPMNCLKSLTIYNYCFALIIV